LSFIALCSSAQTVTYTYDNAGNRIRREIVLNRQNAPAAHAIASSYNDRVAGKDFRIHPNPTHGALSLEIIGYEASDNGRYTVVSTGGQIIVNQKIASAISSLDISSQANGIYILHIVLNGQERTWKIIKK